MMQPLLAASGNGENMRQIEEQILNGSTTKPQIASVTGREALALEALRELIAAFSKSDSLKELAESVAFSLSGQFSTANVFVCIKNPEGKTEQPIYFGTGAFASRDAVLSKDFTCGTEPLCEFGYAQPIQALHAYTQLQHFSRQWQDAGVELVGELGHKNRVVGFVGLGERVDKHPYTREDLELLSTLVETISPPVSGMFFYRELVHVNAWYEGILNSVQPGVVIVGSTGQIRVVNRSCRALFIELMPEVANQELVGMKGHDLFCSAHFPGWCDVFMRARTADASTQMIETLVARTDNGERIFNATISKLRNAEQDGEDMIITLLDVTEQKETERHLFDLEKVAERGIMVSSITHDLNNFLGMILGGVELTQIQLAKGNMEKVTSSLERLKGNAERMERFTAGLLDYGRLNSTKTEGGLNEVIADVIAFLMPNKRFSGVHVTAQFDPQIPIFEFDADQLSQLLINLLNNGADAIAEKTGTDGQLNVITKFEENTVILQVSDNGCGMTPELKEKLFRAHFTTKKTGHGYGLVTCAKIISNHQAEVQIDSALGAGTTFTFRFPVTPA